MFSKLNGFARIGANSFFDVRTLIIWIVLTFLCAYAGPFGTFSYDFGFRLQYWGAVVVISSLMGRGCTRLAARIPGPRNPFLLECLSIVLMVFSFTPVLWALNYHLLQIGTGNWAEFLYYAQYVAIISTGIVLLRNVLPGLFVDGANPAEMEAPPPPPRLARRLPDEFHGPILRLTGQDHFVLVVAACGTYRLRLRFADAIDEMDTAEGHCTHRSHWVARQAIAGVERGNGRIRLRLTNGDEVPVSRKYRPDLELAGII